jgi:hypothetical protein
MNAEDRELRALVDQAFELRETPYVLDAVEAIVDWWDRRYLRARERRDQEFAELVRLLERTGVDALRPAA